MRMINRFIDYLLILTSAAFGVAAMVLMPTPAHAQDKTPAYCEARVHLAELILDGMKDGTPIENINVVFERAAPTAEMEKAREDWVQTLKAEILLERLSSKDDVRIVRAIAARCNGREVSAGFIHAASSEAIAKPSRTQECSELLVDQIYIGNMLGNDRATPDELRTIAANTASAKRITPERLYAILPLIDAAEKAQKANKLQEWFDEYWHACVDGAS